MTLRCSPAINVHEIIDVYRKRSVLNQALHLYEQINLGNRAIVASYLNPMIRHQNTGMKILPYTT